jgi:hypothetical protein
MQQARSEKISTPQRLQTVPDHVVRLTTNIAARRIPLNRQILIAIVW